MDEYSKNKIETSYFNIISVFFLFIFMFYGFRKGIKDGFKFVAYSLDTRVLDVGFREIFKNKGK